jgi:hypothetical protein
LAAINIVMANPPPPYSDITGISRAVMKDNAQVTLAQYNGNARPGEIVVNLETNPPALFVGNNLGELTAISSGNNVNAVTVDVTNTNGLTTVYYPTFVEDRTTAQTVRADVDLTYRTDDNLLTVGNLSVTGNILANNIGTLEQLSTKYMIFDTVPMNNLPNPAGNVGLRGFVNDANLVAAGNFGAQITDGGGNIVPVWSDGSVWRIG